MPFRLGPPARPRGWTRSERCSGCFTAVPSLIQRVGFTPCMAISPAARFYGGRGGDVRANQGAAGVDGVRIADVEASGVTEFLDGKAWSELYSQLRSVSPAYIVVDSYSDSMIRRRCPAILEFINSSYTVAFVGASGTWYVLKQG